MTDESMLPQARLAIAAEAIEGLRGLFAAEEGPCLEAASSRTPVRAVIAAGRERWPEFATAAAELGALASLSVPLVMGAADSAHELVGSLNLYSDTAAAFDPFDENLVRLYTVTAGQAITNANRWQHSRETVTQLEQALTSRTDIDMAKGALMAMHGCDSREAFDRLKVESQKRNVKLRDLAVELLELLERLKANSWTVLPCSRESRRYSPLWPLRESVGRDNVEVGCGWLSGATVTRSSSEGVSVATAEPVRPAATAERQRVREL